MTRSTKRSLTQVDQLAPGLQLPADTSPKIRVAFEEALRIEEERRARRSAVTVACEPVAAPPVADRAVEVAARVVKPYRGLDVRLTVRDARSGAEAVLPMAQGADGRFSSRVPAELVQPSAKLSLRVEAYDGAELVASAPAAGARPVLIAVPAHRAAIDVRSPHAGAEVDLDGTSVGRIPLDAPIRAEPGRRNLTLRTGIGRVDQEVVLAPGEVAAVTLTVAPGPSTRIRVGTGLMVAGGAGLVSSGVLAVLANIARQQLAGAVARESGSELPKTDFSQVRGFEANSRRFATASIITAVAGAALGALGAALFFGGRG